MSDLVPLDRVTTADRATVGGKAVGLAALIAAGLPVPPGFCVPTTADPQLAASIAEAYRALGGGLVAVRSSATAEDDTAASFAGQQASVIGVEGPAAVLDAIGRCWASLDHSRAYRREHGIGDELAMAVIVQRLVPAEVAGVLFTRDPDDESAMTVEASWGLGEAVVAGRVTPDRFRLAHATGTVLDRRLGAKTIRVTTAGVESVSAEQQAAFCLTDEQLAELADLGRRVESACGGPRDVEWAWADGCFWLLQARPITAASPAEREQLRQDEIARVWTIAEPGGTVWARINLAESLPAPTPMTWGVLQRLLSAAGGMGLMYRDLGFTPAPALAGSGAYDLVAGRTYLNLNREPRFQHGDLPFGHPFAALKADPSRALAPRAEVLPERAGLGFWLRLPAVLWRAARAARRVAAMGRTFADRFRNHILPAYLRDVEAESAVDLVRESSAELLRRFDRWSERVLVEFARDALKPGALTSFELERQKVSLATIAAQPDPAADLAGALQELAAGRLDDATFIERFGHRGPEEMELSQPRWSEKRTGMTVGWVERVFERGPPASDGGGPRSKTRSTHPTELLGLRETAKHYLMLGYAHLRRILLELDRRHGLNGGIFFLTPAELPRLVAGDDLRPLIAERRRRRRQLLTLPVPPVLFSDDLGAIGRPLPPPAGATTLQGVPLSAGVGEGPALVLTQPTPVPPGEHYVLVCPSTDPGWVPLFAGACGLVLEVGGVLSHGAIVAREFGLPAVAGVTDATRRFRTGQRLRVDGSQGVVTVLP